MGVLNSGSGLIEERRIWIWWQSREKNWALHIWGCFDIVTQGPPQITVTSPWGRCGHVSVVGHTSHILASVPFSSAQTSSALREMCFTAVAHLTKGHKTGNRTHAGRVTEHKILQTTWSNSATKKAWLRVLDTNEWINTPNDRVLITCLLQLFGVLVGLI